ncbi:hypothetical protein TRVA0_038S00958 [Trichomonascus vanleenenianus]|uniref:cysteine protease ATG4 n=1 Tax=Trichomonascus vanleenenianus TaxID=2268995 RepID=UPI003ECAE6B5
MATGNGNPTFRRMFQYLWDKENLNTDHQNEIVCLGVPYSPTSSSVEDNDECKAKWPEDFVQDVDSRIWLTYRTNFPLIPRTPNGPSTISIGGILRGSGIDLAGFTSDIGWGCMIRTAQSLLANALASLRLGRDWRRDGKEWEIVKLFADDPEAPFSLHRFVEHGKLFCGKSPGEWFGPSAAASSIKALAEASLDDLGVYISDGSDIYENRLLAVAGYQLNGAQEDLEKENTEEREGRPAQTSDNAVSAPLPIANHPPITSSPHTTEPGHSVYPATTTGVSELSQIINEPLESSRMAATSQELSSLSAREISAEPSEISLISETTESSELTNEFGEFSQTIAPQSSRIDNDDTEDRRLSDSHEHEPATPDNNLEPEAPINASSSSPSNPTSAKFKPTLVLLGIRLGIDNVNPVYWQSLKSLLEYPQSVGIAGGRPSSSHYFYGFQGDYLFYLDPHLPRPVLEISPNGSLSESALDSVHSKRIRMLHLSEMDPSMLVGFLIRDFDDWNDWKMRVEKTLTTSIINISPHEPIINCHSSISVGSDDEGEFVDVGTETTKVEKPVERYSDVIIVSEEPEDPILIQGSSFPGTDEILDQEACSRVVSADSTIANMHDSSFKFTDESYEEFMPDEGYGAPVMVSNDQSFESIEPAGNDYDDWEEMVSSLRKQSITN